MKSPVIALAQHMVQAAVCHLQTHLMGVKVLLITMAHMFFYQMIPEAKHFTLELPPGFSVVSEIPGKNQIGE